MPIVLEAVQTAAAEHRATVVELGQRLSALEAPERSAHSADYIGDRTPWQREVRDRMATLEAQQRASERPVLEARAEQGRRLAEMQRALDELVVADALFARRGATPAPDTATVPADAAVRTVQPEVTPQAPTARIPLGSHGNLLEFLSRADLCMLRAASWRHAFLSGFGAEPPKRAAAQNGPDRVPTSKMQSKYGNIGFGSGLGS